MGTRRTLAGGLVALSLLLSGCGGGGGNKDQPAAQETKRQPDPLADKAWADRINLTIADLGPGWSIDTTPDEGGGSDEAFDRAFDQALAAKGLALSAAKTADADSPDFIKGEDTGASSSVSVYEEESPAAKDFSVTASEEFIGVLSDIFTRAFQDEFAKDPELRGVTVSPLQFTKVPFPVLAQEAFALKGQTTVRGKGLRVVLHFQVVAVRQDRAVALIFAYNTPREFPVADLQALATKLAQRMTP